MQPDRREALLVALAAAVGMVCTRAPDAAPERFFTSHTWVRVEEKEPPSPTDVLTIPHVTDMPLDLGALSRAIVERGVPVDFLAYPKGAPPALKTRAHICFDREHLYVSFRGDKSRSYGLKAVKREKEESKIWSDDCFEVFVDPFLSRNEYFHYILNSLGDRYDAACVEKMVADPRAADPSEKKGITEFDAGFRGSAAVRAEVGQDSWTAAVRIPFADFGVEHAPVGSTWGLNLCRANWENKELSQWKVTSGGFHQPRKFGAVRLGEKRKDIPASFALPFLGYGKNVLVVRTANTDEQRDGQLLLALFDGTRKKIGGLRRDVRIPRGESETRIPFLVPPAGPKPLRRGEGPPAEEGMDLRLVAELVCRGESLGHYVKNASLPGILELNLPLAQIYTSDREIKGTLRIALGEESLGRLRLRFGIRSEERTLSAELAEVEGNHLDFGLDPSGLTPGEYTLEVRALEDQGAEASAASALISTERRFWVVEPPFGRGPE